MITALSWALVIFTIGAILLPFWYCWCDHTEEMSRIEAHKAEMLCCYDSEQSFLDIEDDAEHLESISPEPVQKAETIVNIGDTQHGPAHHPGDFVHTKKTVTIGLPSMTEEEKADIAAELAEEEVDA